MRIVHQAQRLTRHAWLETHMPYFKEQQDSRTIGQSSQAHVLSTNKIFGIWAYFKEQQDSRTIGKSSQAHVLSTNNILGIWATCLAYKWSKT
jgi:hypothetical protein